ncbi:MAG: transglycosylase SLT domain-containing protein [Vicinamibacteria bacterium]
MILTTPFVFLLAAASAAGQPLPWVEPVPADAAEARLAQIGQARGFAGPAGSAAELLRLAEESAGTRAAGLARFAAGLALLEAERPAEAAAALRHEDVARTALVDHAFLSLGRALAAAGDASAPAAYVEAAQARPQGPLACPARLLAGEALLEKQPARALGVLEPATQPCGRRPELLLLLARSRLATGDRRGAALLYDELDRDFPARDQGRDARRALRKLASSLPKRTPAESAARSFAKAGALARAGRHTEALRLLGALRLERLQPAEADAARVLRARSHLARGASRRAEAVLEAVPTGSPHEAEAAFLLARIQARSLKSVDGYEDVVARFPGSPWAEEALVALGNHFQKDALHDDALPHYRRLIEAFPDGRYVERATWRVGLGDLRAGRHEQAAGAMERLARARPRASITPGLLYWSARARLLLSQSDRARALLDEVVRRFKHSYHGRRAQDALAALPPAAPAVTAATDASDAQAPVTAPPALAAPDDPLPPEDRERLRQLLLIGRFEEAADEARALNGSRTALATLALAESRRGRLRPAINAMKRALPEWVGEAGDQLPSEVWKVLFPLEHEEPLLRNARARGLDPALVAALICQESTFDPGAVSVAGARGLMQIMPATGRSLARSLKVRYSRARLHDPSVALAFGTHYLKGLLDDFGERPELALAAYNAGPHRVAAWTAEDPAISAEDFIESIPFTETRFYVTSILGAREEYRRLYGLVPLGEQDEAAP